MDPRHDRKDEKEPYPNAYKNIWKIQLGDEYFPSIPNKADRFVTQVFLCDYMPLQMIGPDRIFDSDQLRIVGAGLADMIDGSFYFDPKEQSLYVKVGGHPEWYRMEIGVRNAAVSISSAHDVVVRGLEMRHNLYGSVCWRGRVPARRGRGLHVLAGEPWRLEHLLLQGLHRAKVRPVLQRQQRPGHEYDAELHRSRTARCCSTTTAISTTAGIAAG